MYAMLNSQNHIHWLSDLPGDTHIIWNSQNFTHSSGNCDNGLSNREGEATAAWGSSDHPNGREFNESEFPVLLLVGVSAGVVILIGIAIIVIRILTKQQIESSKVISSESGEINQAETFCDRIVDPFQTLDSESVVSLYNASVQTGLNWIGATANPDLWESTDE
jgi:hypothetical protein